MYQFEVKIAQLYQFEVVQKINLPIHTGRVILSSLGGTVKKVKHIPGLWFVSPDPFDFKTNAIDILSTKTTKVGDGILVATIFDSTVYNKDVKEANARLIAAAPEMLEVLEALIEDTMLFKTVESDLIKRAKAVVAKAKGGAK